MSTNRIVGAVIVSTLLLVSCSDSGGDEDRITRIDGPAVVDMDDGGADQGG